MAADVNEIRKRLKEHYPNARIALNYGNTMELLVATILSAQCTDVMVNRITAVLFKKYRTVEAYAGANLQEFEQEIKSAGFYHNKARAITSAARIILDKFDGKVPSMMAELVTLPGVARKTANIVLYNAYGVIEGIAVDTHVRRVSRRLGLTRNEDPDKIEQDLMKQLPREEWGIFSYWLIDHGRGTCFGRKPNCGGCFLNDICPMAFKVTSNK